ncbi:MAG: hypothetical protein E6G14_11310 [Actinobacteria bacterium]|nr:MAG: hypothetical protein E6G14_11310 [Actinomycetota bacterium]
MPRAERVPSVSGFFHVTSRASRPLRLFADRDDCVLFLQALSRAHAEHGLETHAYCLLGTHFHLVVRAEPDALTRSMRVLKGWYAHELNRRRGRVGPVFDGRYFATEIATEEHAGAAMVYVALNPVRAGLTQHPDHWPFSSHRAHAGLDTRPEWLMPLERLGLFSHEADYRNAIAGAVRQLRSSRAVGEAGSDRRV